VILLVFVGVQIAQEFTNGSRCHGKQGSGQSRRTTADVLHHRSGNTITSTTNSSSGGTVSVRSLSSTAVTAGGVTQSRPKRGEFGCSR